MYISMQWNNMEKLHDGSRLRLVIWFLPLLVMMLMLGMRVETGASWNVWTLQFMWHVLRPDVAHKLPASIPEGRDRAKIWLTRDALATGDIQLAKALVKSITIPNDPLALSVEAAVLERQDDFTNAIQILLHARDYNSLINLSNDAARANDQAAALDALYAALTIDPTQGVIPLVYYLTSSKGDFLGAENVLRNALTTYPESSLRFSWYLSLADNLRRQKKYNEAEEVYRAVMVQNPNYLQTYIGLGWVYYERGDGLQRATAEFQNAIAINKTAGDGYYAMAQLLTREHRYEEADDWYELALTNDPENYLWIIGRANNARAAGDLNLALNNYQEAARLSPDNSTIYYEMAWTYRLNNQPEEAKKSIEKALSLMAPPSELYYVRAGQIYEWCGENVRALDAYKSAIRINPENLTAQQGVSRLSGS
jgi:tetratricopeptide (TPR) repeat protein